MQYRLRDGFWLPICYNEYTYDWTSEMKYFILDKAILLSTVLMTVVLCTGGCSEVATQIPGIETQSATTESPEIVPSITPKIPSPIKPTPSQSSSPTYTPIPTSTPVVLSGAGDISICGQKGDDKTAALLGQLPGWIFTAGDNSNEVGSAYQYLNCFAPSWGQYLERMRPAPGNHDYGLPGGSGYYEYFGEFAGPVNKGFYSYDLGSWHIIVLNSNCSFAGCSAGSRQEKWLRKDLEAHPSLCTLAYWHHPRWSSGKYGDDRRMDAFWNTLYEFGVEVVINGHVHIYERFAPLNPSGEIDENRGIRQFIAGTGGASHYEIEQVHLASEVRNNDTFGVLSFNLLESGYSWEFIPVEGGIFTDSGTGECHK